MEPAFKRIDVVVLFVSDLERSKEFYRDLLGLAVAQEDDDSTYFQLDGASLLLLSIPGAQDLLSSTALAGHSAGASSQLAVFVDDVNAIHADLAAKGVEFIREPIDRPWGMRTAHFKDPDGHVWEISQTL